METKLIAFAAYLGLSCVVSAAEGKFYWGTVTCDNITFSYRCLLRSDLHSALVLVREDAGSKCQLGGEIRKDAGTSVTVLDVTHSFPNEAVVFIDVEVDLSVVDLVPWLGDDVDWRNRTDVEEAIQRATQRSIEKWRRYGIFMREQG